MSAILLVSVRQEALFLVFRLSPLFLFLGFRLCPSFASILLPRETEPLISFPASLDDEIFLSSVVFVPLDNDCLTDVMRFPTIFVWFC